MNRRLTFTEWLVLIVALTAANFFLFKLHHFVVQVRARQALYERTIDCQQHVDFYVAAGALDEAEREAATSACVACVGADAERHVCKYWLGRLE